MNGQICNQKIYRVQDKNGRGPWQPNFSHVWIEMREDHDNLISMYNEFHCTQLFFEFPFLISGCLTVDQLKRWFTESEYRTLLRYGYKAVEVPEVKILASSSIQCVAGRDLPTNRGAKRFNLYQ